VIDPASRRGEAAPELPEPAAAESPEASPRPRRLRRGVPRPAFAHASEAEMSRILDFYGVEWHYEPTTFPILWNLEGEVVESFSPDFFLPEFDLYLEMTTLKQSLVRKKNRKLRRLRELYPDVRIKLFYARDFRAMMLKYGRLGLAESLTGTSGQLVAGALIGQAAGARSVPGRLGGRTVSREPAASRSVTRRRTVRAPRPSADVEIA
jgi:hypothetical protein